MKRFKNLFFNEQIVTKHPLTALSQAKQLSNSDSHEENSPVMDENLALISLNID